MIKFYNFLYQNNSNVDCFICLCERSINTIILHYKYFKYKIILKCMIFFQIKTNTLDLTFFRFFGLLLKLVESHHQLLFLSLHLLSLYLYGLSSLLLTLQLSSADKTQSKRSTVTFAQDATLYPHIKLSSHTAHPKVVIVP